MSTVGMVCYKALQAKILAVNESVSESPNDAWELSAKALGTSQRLPTKEFGKPNCVALSV